MSLQTIISIFFRCINFGILSALMVYVYKKYLRPLLVEGVRKEQQALLSLVHEEHDVKQKRSALEVQLHDDQNLIIVLKKRIAHWATVEQENQQKRDAYRVRQHTALQEKARIKQVYITNYMIEKKSLPLIIQHARTLLVERYNNNKECKCYIECIIETLTQESAAHECR